MEKQNKMRKLFFISLVAICVVVLIVSLYNVLIIYIPQKREQSRFAELQQMMNQEAIQSPKDQFMQASNANYAKYAAIKALNSDFRGWLTISDTDINYPVVKSSEDEPEYYLHRDFDKNYSFSGTLFIGANSDENSDIFIIYGHNMKTNTMFGKLDDYDDEVWAGKHQDIEFDTLEEHRVYRVFSSFQTKVSSDNEYRYYENVGNFSDEEYNEITANLKDISKIDIGNAPTHKEQILILSTCSYYTENGRFVVAAYRIE